MGFFSINFSIYFFFVLKKVLKFDYEWRNLLILFFSFGATVFTSFISGNISFILYGFISLSIYCLYKRFFNYYYLIIIFVSLFKFYYLSFLIIPFYLQGLKSINKIFLSIFLFVFIQYFFYINNPNLTLDFLDVIQGKYLDNLPVRMQTGTGLYSLIEKGYKILILRDLQVVHRVNYNVINFIKRRLTQEFDRIKFYLREKTYTNKIKQTNYSRVIIGIPVLGLILLTVLSTFFYSNNIIWYSFVILNLIYVSLHLGFLKFVTSNKGFKKAFGLLFMFYLDTFLMIIALSFGLISFFILKKKY